MVLYSAQQLFHTHVYKHSAYVTLYNLNTLTAYASLRGTIFTYMSLDLASEFLIMRRFLLLRRNLSRYLVRHPGKIIIKSVTHE